MNVLAATFSSWTLFGSALGNHLWQSTVFAAVAALLTLLLRKNHARTRYWLWLAASLKFLLPFALLVTAGSRLQWKQAPAQQSQVSIVMDQITQPFAPAGALDAPVILPRTAPRLAMRVLPLAALTIWCIGFAALLIFWSVRWRRITRAIRESKPLESGREVEMLRGLERNVGLARATRLVSGSASLEPGIVGVLRPVMFLPAGIAERLNDSQLSAVMLHELCHLRRRDNLAAVLHMLVESVFWFHPVVWWMGTQLIDERERACDEEVLALGSDPQAYAEGILKVCEFYLETPLVCVAGITGSNLKKRIEAIMIHRIARKLELGKKLLLAAIAAAALIAPVVFGLFHPAQSLAQTAESTTTTSPGFASVMIRPNTTGAVMPEFHIKDPVGDFVVFKTTDGRFLANHATLHMLIRVAYEVNDSQVIGGPEWVNQERYDVDARFLNGIDEAKFLSLPMEERSRLIDQRKPMLQELWAERFKLKVHRETRNLPIYSLIVASGGPKMSPATPGDTYSSGFKLQGRAMGQGVWAWQDHLFGQGVSMSALAQHLSQRLGHQVIDNTGLKGNFDFTLLWKAAENQAASTVDSMEQLGLQLVPQTGPVEVVVIDHAEPAETVAGTAGLLKPVSARNDSQSGASSDVERISITAKGTPDPSALYRSRVLLNPGDAEFENVTLKQFLKVAYRLDDSQVSGGPAWVSAELYDMSIKAATPLKGDALRLEVQKVLTEYFKVATHRELKSLPVYELTVGSSGAKLSEARSDNAKEGIEVQQGRIVGNGVKLKELVDYLQLRTERPVIDKTGLNGTYDFSLTVEGMSQPRKLGSANDNTALFHALSEQLGLEATPQTEPVEVLVIDHAEQIDSARIAQNH